MSEWTHEWWTFLTVTYYNNRSMCCRKALKVEKHLLVRSKTNWWVHTKNNNTRNEIQLELSFWAHKTCYSGILWFVFCFVCLPVASQKCSALCLNGCLVCNYVDIYGTKQNNNKNLTYRVTWSNLIFIYVSGQRKKKSIIWKCSFGKSYVLTIPHIDPYSEMPAEFSQ